MEISQLPLIDKVFNLTAAMILITFLSLPWILIARRIWPYITSSLAGVDGITDAQEFKLGASIVILIVFVIIYFFMIITLGALGWQWGDIHFTYTFLGTTGAEASVIISLLQILRKPTPVK